MDRFESSNKPFVVYWNNMPAPYMVDRFNALARRGNLHLEVWFNAPLETGRSWEVNESEWEFPYRYVPSFNFASRRLHFPLPLFERNLPDILVMLYSKPVFLFGWTLAKLRGVRTVFRTLKTFNSWVRRRWYKEYFKKQIFSRVDGVETVGKDGRRYAMRYGVNPYRVFRATHAVDIDHFIKSRETALKDRKSIRSNLGVSGVTFIYVGRLWWGKGLNYLLEAFKKVHLFCPVEVSLLLVGDGPEEFYLRECCRKSKLTNVIFAGFRQKSELPLYYTASDIFVFPTLGDPYGLVVDEAMASSLPVISTSAAGEINERIEDGVNGYIVPPENVFLLCERMKQLAEHPQLRIKMGEISVRKIRGNTPDRWAKDFEQIVECTLSISPKKKV